MKQLPANRVFIAFCLALWSAPGLGQVPSVPGARDSTALATLLEDAARVNAQIPDRLRAYRARIETEIAYLYEYESMLGRMRKELPPRDPNVHGGWKLAARPEYVEEVLRKGAQKARVEAQKTMALVRRAVGMTDRPA